MNALTKIQSRLLLLCLVSICSSLNVTSVYSQVPHLLYGEIRNSDGAMPSIVDIRFSAFILSRPTESLSHDCPGQTGLLLTSNPQRLLWLVQCSDFSSAWAIGEHLRVEIQNVSTGEGGGVEVILNAEPHQDTGSTALPVQISVLEATFADNAVTVHWQTVEEVNCLGFNILRCDDETGDFSKINNPFIHAKGGLGRTQGYFYYDNSVQSGRQYFYKLEEVGHSGERACFGPVSVLCPSAAIPKRFSLAQNYPNPLNQSTRIRFEVPVDAEVKVEILDIQGQAVRTLLVGQVSGGTHSVDWDGLDVWGNAVPSGLYLYRMMTGGVCLTRKLILAR